MQGEGTEGWRSGLEGEPRRIGKRAPGRAGTQGEVASSERGQPDEAGLEVHSGGAGRGAQVLE